MPRSPAQSAAMPTSELASARHLHNTQFHIDLEWNEQWDSVGTLTILEDSAYFNSHRLEDVSYFSQTNALSFVWRDENVTQCGLLFFSPAGDVVNGTLVASSNDNNPVFASAGGGTPVSQIRGAIRSTVYSTALAEQLGGPARAWHDFTIERQIKGSSGLAYQTVTYKIGDLELDSFKTVVGKLNQQAATYTISSVIAKDSDDFSDVLDVKQDDSFELVVHIFEERLSGTYTSKSGKSYAWTGQVRKEPQRHASLPTPASVGLYAFVAPTVQQVSALAAQPVFASAVTQTKAPSLLAAINSLQTEKGKDEKGAEVFITQDKANSRAKDYLNALLVNRMPLRIRDEFLGGSKAVSEAVAAIGRNNDAFLREYALLMLGKSICEDKSVIANKSKIISRIKKKELEEKLNKFTSDEKFFPMYMALYTEAYKETAPSINAYIADQAAGTNWAQALSTYVLDDKIIGPWAAAAVADADSVRNMIMQVYTKLRLLEPTGALAAKTHSELTAQLLTFGATQAPEHALTLDGRTAQIDAELVQNMTEGVLRTLSGKTIEDGRVDKFVTEMNIIRDHAGLRSATTMRNVANELVAALNTVRAHHADALWTYNVDTIKQKVVEILRMSANPDVGYMSKLGSRFLNWASRYAGFILSTLAIGGTIVGLVKGGRSLAEMSMQDWITTGMGSLYLVLTGVRSFVVGFFNSQLIALFDAGKGIGQSFVQRAGMWFARGVTQQGGIGVKLVGSFGNFMRFLGAIASWVAVGFQVAAMIDALKYGSSSEKWFEAIKLCLTIVSAVLTTLAMFTQLTFLSLSLGVWGAIFALITIVAMVVQLIWFTKEPKDVIDEFVEGDLKAAGYAT